MATSSISTTGAPSFTGPGLDALLGEATRLFGAPVALLSLGSAHTVRAVYASAPVIAADGRQLATLCLLGVPQARALQSSTARLHEIAARVADALEAAPTA